MGGLLRLVQRRGDWAGPQPAQAPPRCTKCNSPPINGQSPITVLLYNGPLLCGFNVSFKGLKIFTFCELSLVGLALDLVDYVLQCSVTVGWVI